MNTKLTAIAAKLNARRLGSAVSQKSTQVVNEIYNLVFQADFYRDIWDEPVLLALKDLIAEQPPKMFGPQLEFISQRTAQVVAINDLFSALILRTTEALPTLLARVAVQLEVAQELVLLQTNGTLGNISTSNSQPLEKLATALKEISRQAPSVSASLNNCFEAVVRNG